MTCTLQPPIYNKNCSHCMQAKIVMLRSPDKRLTLKLQLGTFDYMGARMAEQVKEALKK